MTSPTSFRGVIKGAGPGDGGPVVEAHLDPDGAPAQLAALEALAEVGRELGHDLLLARVIRDVVSKVVSDDCDLVSRTGSTGLSSSKCARRIT